MSSVHGSSVSLLELRAGSSTLHPAVRGSVVCVCSSLICAVCCWQLPAVRSASTNMSFVLFAVWVLCPVNSVHMLGHGRIVYCSWCCSTRLPHTENEALVSGQVLCGVLRSNRSEQLCWRREDRSVTPRGRLVGCAIGGCIMSKASGDVTRVSARRQLHIPNTHQGSCTKTALQLLERVGRLAGGSWPQHVCRSLNAVRGVMSGHIMFCTQQLCTDGGSRPCCSV